LGAVSGSGGSGFSEGWLEFAEAFKSGFFPDTIVLADHDLLLFSVLVFNLGLHCDYFA
jgi:hypothetical protein